MCCGLLYILGCCGQGLLPLQMKAQSRDKGLRVQPSPRRGYDSHSSSPTSSDHPRSQDSYSGKPLPPPVALKPTYQSRIPRGTPDSQPPGDRAGVPESPEDPSQKSVLGKVKAFEKMDHFARTQRVLELQEAQSARVETAFVCRIYPPCLLSFTLA